MGDAGHHRLRARARAATALAAGAALAAGCGSDGEPRVEPRAGTGDVRAETTPPETTPPEPPLDVPVRIVRARLYAHRVGADDRTLDVVYGRSGSERFERVDVRSTPRALLVAVKLRSPKAGITFDLRIRCARVVLDEPLAGRPVLAARTRRPVATFDRAPLVAREAVEVVCD